MKYLGVLGSGGGPGPGPGPGPGVPALARNPDYTDQDLQEQAPGRQEPAHEGAAVVWPDGEQPVQGHRLADAQAKKVLMGRRAFSITANKNRNVTVRIKKSAYKRLKKPQEHQDHDHRLDPRVRRQAAA